MKYNLLLLAFSLLVSNNLICAQSNLVSAAPVQQSSGFAKNIQEQGNGKVLYGYCPPDMKITGENGVGYPTKENIKVTAAIRFSAGMMNLLKGRQIYRLKIGAADNMEGVKVFVRKSDGTSLREVTTTFKLGWNEIILETPLEIPDDEELYIGYTFMQAPDQLLVASASGTAKLNGMLLAVGDDPLTQQLKVGNLCLSVEVDGSEAEFQYLGSLKSIYSSNPYLPMGENRKADFKICFFNEGDTYVTNVKLGRSFNGKELGDTVCTFKRAVRENQVGKYTLSLVPEESGKYTFTLKEVEGIPVPATFKTAQVSFYNGEKTIPRTVLIEEFTSQVCGNCPDGQKALHELIKDHEDRVAMVLHHSGYQPDIFSTKESQAYCYFYNSNELYAPAMMINRTNLSEYDKKGIGTPVFDPRSLTAASFSQELSTPAMVFVDIKSSYEEATRKLTVTVSGQRINDLIGDYVGLTVFLLESKYKASQSTLKGIDQSFEHNNFLRSVLSDVKGDVITFDNTGSYSKEYTYTIPEEYTSTNNSKTTAHPENMNIVAFVSNFDTVNTDNCVVLNANKTKSLNDLVVGIKTGKDRENIVSVYVEDGMIHVSGEYKDFKIFNLQGIAVYNEDLDPGVYMIKIKDKNNQETVRKVLVPGY